MLSFTDQPLHVQPMPHRTHPHRRRRSCAEGAASRRDREEEVEYETAWCEIEEGNYARIDALGAGEKSLSEWTEHDGISCFS